MVNKYKVKIPFVPEAIRQQDYSASREQSLPINYNHGSNNKHTITLNNIFW